MECSGYTKSDMDMTWNLICFSTSVLEARVEKVVKKRYLLNGLDVFLRSLSLLSLNIQSIGSDLKGQRNVGNGARLS
jgi:hypothetical protein